MPETTSYLGNIKTTYLFRDLNKKAKKLEGEGKNVIRLHIGTPDILTPEPIREAIAKASLDKKFYHGYPDDFHPYPGLKALREALAADYSERHGVDVSSEQFVIDSGAKSSLHNLARLFGNEGGNIVLPHPAYPAYEGAIALAGKKIAPIVCNEENGFKPLLSSLDNEILKNTSAVYACYPNNPTGTVADRKYLTEFFEEAARMDIGVIYDVAYKDFTFNGESAPSSLEFADAEDITLEVDSFSKPFSMVGDRLGWVVGNEKLIEQWTRLKSFVDSGTPNYIQMGGVEALINPEVKKIVKNNMKEYSVRAELMTTGFRNMGLDCKDVKATPYIWAKIPEGFTSESFCNKVLNEANVVLTPGSGFGEAGEGYFRSTIFQPQETLKEALGRMKSLLADSVI